MVKELTDGVTYFHSYISANMNLFGLKFSQMILHTETSKLMYN